jgi:hypothetical protein
LLVTETYNERLEELSPFLVSKTVAKQLDAAADEEGESGC